MLSTVRGGRRWTGSGWIEGLLGEPVDRWLIWFWVWLKWSHPTMIIEGKSEHVGLHMQFKQVLIAPIILCLSFSITILNWGIQTSVRGETRTNDIEGAGLGEVSTSPAVRDILLLEDTRHSWNETRMFGDNYGQRKQWWPLDGIGGWPSISQDTTLYYMPSA